MARKSSKKQKQDCAIITAIGGDGDISDSPIRIEHDYLDRERRENLEFQGFDITEFGYDQREITYSAREASFRNSEKNMEKCEAERVNYDPLDDQNIDRDKMKEENMEERGEVIMKNTVNNFVSSVEMKLEKAKFRIIHGQSYKNGDLTREFTRIEVTNNDLDVRRTFWISAKENMTLNFTPKRYQEIEIAKGTFSLDRDPAGKKVSFSINGKTRTYIVENLISMTEEVEKVTVKENDPFAEIA